MITLNEIAYNIKNLAYGGKTSTENSISISQIKHWIHYHRAKLIADNIDKGILNNEALYQSMSAPSVTAGFIENHSKASNGELRDSFLVYSSMAYAHNSTSQDYLDGRHRDFYGREVYRSQIRGDFRNFGMHGFWIPRPLMLKDNSGIKNVEVIRNTHHPDDISTTELNEETDGFNKRPISLYHKSYQGQEFGIYNKFTNESKPSYWQGTARLNRAENSQGNYIMLNNLQVSPNYHGGLNTPANKKIFWKYQGVVNLILENPTEIDIMYDRYYMPKINWDDATTPYPIPMEYVSDLIQRVIQVEMQTELKTMPDIITDGMDDLIKLKSKGGVQVMLYKNIDYKLYYNIIRRFFEILIRDVVERGHEVSLPNQMGYVYLDERPHKRAFHIRVDNEATKQAGETIFYKVPILDDFYKKLVWVRPTKYRNCKIMPLGYSRKIINKN